MKIPGSRFIDNSMKTKLITLSMMFLTFAGVKLCKGQLRPVVQKCENLEHLLGDRPDRDTLLLAVKLRETIRCTDQLSGRFLFLIHCMDHSCLISV